MDVRVLKEIKSGGGPEGIADQSKKFAQLVGICCVDGERQPHESCSFAW